MTRFLICLLAFGLCFALTTAAPPDKPAPTADKGVVVDVPPAKMPKDTCVKPCWDCAVECMNCMKHAREHKMEDIAKMCQVCHHACLLCHVAVGGKTPHAWETCELCEKFCNDCAAVCEKGTEEHMKKCAKACRDCAKACAEARKA